MKKVDKKIFIFIIILFIGILLFPHFSSAKEVLSTGLSPANIQAAVNSASPGDTVVLPAGTYNSFNATVYVPNGISMRGQGRTSTILKASSSIYMFIWNNGRTSSSYRVEISGFQLIGTGAGIGNSGIGIRMNELQDVKVHDLEVRNFAGIGVYFVECRGVIYNSFFYDIYPQDLGQSGYCVAVVGDDVWDDPKPPLGTQEMVFIENNYFSNCKHGVASNSDSKHVVRYNEFHNPYGNRDMIDEHGKQPQHNVGSNIWEVYENKVYGDPSTTIDGGMNARGGSGVIWNNKFYDVESPGSTPPHKAINMYLDDYSGTYPNMYQIMDTYLWGNTLNDSPLNTVNVSTAALNWIKENRDYFMYKKPGYTPYTYPHPLRGSTPLPPSDTIKPIVTSFDIQPRTTTGSITATYTVTDNQSLLRVELWRTTDSNGQPNGSNWIQVTNRTISGTSFGGNFTNNPSTGTYWYGIHVVDAANNIGTEQTPIKIVIQSTAPPPIGPVCGDASCNGTETCSSCPRDCGSCTPSPPIVPVCGDSLCGSTEACSSCPQDCGVCPSPPPTAPVCGDALCGSTETCSSCPRDCGVCPSPPPVAPICGDVSCNGTETCSSCPQDCGTCVPPSQQAPPDSSDNIIVFENPLNQEDIKVIIDSFGDVLKVIAGVAGIIMIIISGIIIMTSGGDTEKLNRGKRMLKYTIIGVAIIGSAGFIIDLIQELINK